MPPPPSAARMGFVDLPPLTLLRVENAYFKEGSARNLEDYIATQIAHLRVERRRGLRTLRVESVLPAIPKGQVGASDLVPISMRRFRSYRYYYAVVFAKQGRGGVGSAVLLGANSADELERLGVRLVDEPDSVCGPEAKNCTVFPRTCTVSLEMEITVNGISRVIGWRAAVGGVAPAGKDVRLTRIVNGREVLTDLKAGATATRMMVMLPGDRLQWD